MSAPDLDPFAFAGSGDEAILSLFRRWIDGHRAAEQISTAIEAEEEFDAAISRICDIEHEIADIPATGPVGFAVKAYLACHYEHPPGRAANPVGVSLLTRDHVIDPDERPDHYVSFHCIAAVIRDAARVAPEIAELAVMVTAPPPDKVAAEAVRVRRSVFSEGRGR